MFSRSNGSWLVLGLCCAGTFFVGCMIYNLLLVSNEEDQITGATGIQMRTFGKITQICSVTMDLVAILMVTDSVLQDRTFYPRWAPCLKRLWIDACGGWVRVVIIWLMAATGVSMTVWGVLSTGKDATDIRWNDRHLGGFTEIARASLMSFVIFCDLFTVVQDWSFPSFVQPLDVPLDQQVYIAGMWVTEINCDFLARRVRCCLACLPSLPRCCRCWGCCTKCKPDLSWLRITITGPWLTYGPLFGVMLIDLFCTRTQLIYAPSIYGQYVDPVENQIWTILDEAYLQQAYDRGALIQANKDLITYAARRNATTGVALTASAAGDIQLNSRFTNSWVKYLAAAPGFLLMIIFAILVWAANKRRTLLIGMASFVGNAATLAADAVRTVGNAVVSATSKSQVAPGEGGAEEGGSSGGEGHGEPAKEPSEKEPTTVRVPTVAASVQTLT
mmetsp:Transcript_37834/g.117615  ORF Transcript_37834/g.117615 Transcript_37834/m.117615 type:complete len:445 (-) Transcript_37834:61-1395(-)